MVGGFWESISELSKASLRKIVVVLVSPWSQECQREELIGSILLIKRNASIKQNLFRPLLVSLEKACFSSKISNICPPTNVPGKFKVNDVVVVHMTIVTPQEYVDNGLFSKKLKLPNLFLMKLDHFSKLNCSSDIYKEKEMHLDKGVWKSNYFEVECKNIKTLDKDSFACKY
ncbi:hypothetical protein AVEN_100650-1 [Araneus ventricosus]|uniref:Uncharacterized protein n=1 Tax=Araneus ventricosus TaxID=182803 RepID=A0A4Y2TTS1_ARAVE|nr:hypothetical protein AVEN_100650-1 [Araneus ventricosus]